MDPWLRTVPEGHGATHVAHLQSASGMDDVDHVCNVASCCQLNSLPPWIRSWVHQFRPDLKPMVSQPAQLAQSSYLASGFAQQAGHSQSFFSQPAVRDGQSMNSFGSMGRDVSSSSALDPSYYKVPQTPLSPRRPGGEPRPYDDDAARMLSRRDFDNVSPTIGFHTNALGSPAIATASYVDAGWQPALDSTTHVGPGRLELCKFIQYGLFWLLTCMVVVAGCICFVIRFHPMPGHDLIGIGSGLFEAPPLFLILLSSCTTPIFNALLFGPSCSKEQPATVMKGAASLMLCILFILRAVHDLRSSIKVWTMYGLGASERFWSFIVILGSSPNLVKFISNMALIDVYAQSLHWQERHGQKIDSISNAMRLNNGRVFEVYVFASIIYMSVLIMPLLCAVPAIFLYAYLSVPIVIACYLGSKTLALLLPMLSSCICCSGQVAPLQSLAEVPARRTVLELLLPTHQVDVARLSSEGVDQEYTRQANIFAVSGAPLIAWEKYYFWPLLCGSLLTLLSTAAARLYLGTGYTESLSRTLVERSVGERYFTSLQSSPLDIVDVLWWLL